VSALLSRFVNTRRRSQR